jgi:hypothetical protein
MKTFEQFDEHDPFGEEVKDNNIIPQPIEPEHIDPRRLVGLQRMAIEYVTSLYEGEEPDEDGAQYMLEAVVQMFYGDEIFQILNAMQIEREDFDIENDMEPWRGFR